MDASTVERQHDVYADAQSALEAQNPLILTFVDQTRDADIAASDAAEARWREELNKGGRIRKTLRRIWMGENGIAGRYYFEKYKKEASKRIEEEGLSSLYGNDSSLQELAKSATISRFQSEHNEMIHSTAGEYRQELSKDSPFGLAMKQLIRRYASGKISGEETLKEERGRILHTLRQSGADSDVVGEGRIQIDNLVQIAEAVKGAVEHGDSIDRVMEGMKIYTGESRSGVRTEVHKSKVDKVIDKLQKSKIGSLISPETISLAAAVAAGVARAGRGTLLRAFGVTSVPGLIGGVFAGVRENNRVKKERAVHAREVAQGSVFVDEGRRAEIEETRYETASAKQLTDNLEAIFGEKQISPGDLQRGYQALVEAETRVRMSDEQNIDLISYSSAAEVEIERFDLDLARAKAKVILGRRIGDLPEDFRRSLGIESSDTADQALGRSTDLLMSITEDINKKDAVFAKLKRKRVAAATATGFASSFLIGTTVQETVALVDSNYDGMIEHVFSSQNQSSGDRQTLLEGLFHSQSNTVNTTHTVQASDIYTEYSAGNEGGVIDLAANYQLEYNPDGTLNITAPDGSVFVNNIALEADGSLSQGAIDALEEKGAVVTDLTRTITEPHTSLQQLDVKDWLNYQSNKTTNITRDFWYGNDTPEADGNELNVYWAGDGGRTGNGSIGLSVAKMTNEESFNGSDSISWVDHAQNKTLKFVVSASIDSQDQVFMIDVAPDGSITIPPDHPAAQLFSVNEYGQTEFRGGYGEVVELRGIEEDVMHVAPMATLEGDDSISTIQTAVESPVDKIVPKFQITPPPIEAVEVNAPNIVEGFGGPAIVVRRPLENVARNRSSHYNRYRSGYETGTQEELQREGFSPRLIENPDASLELGEELAWYKRRLVDDEGADYVDQIEQAINNSAELQQTPGNVDFVATIPVAAASESDNIYNTLRLLARQDDSDVERSLVLLNVNWLDEARHDPEKATNILKTMAEIDRARRDFPNLRIATIEREYNRTAVESTGGVIGYVARDLQSAALLWLLQQIETGKRSPGNDALVQRYDADTKGMSRHAWRDIRHAVDKYPETDIFKGVTRIGTNKYSVYPGFGIVAEMSTTLSILETMSGNVHTGGANFGIRASTLAAVGGIGSISDGSGVASDDVRVGKRVSAARSGNFANNREGERGYYYNHRKEASRVSSSRRVGRLVGGSTVDTDAERFISRYMRGQWWQDVWSDDGQRGGFSSGAGGYAPRTSGNTKYRNRSERLSSRALKILELNIGEELSYSTPEQRRRVLSLVFKNTPGAYTLDDKDGKVKFSLTRTGRRYIKRYIRGDRSKKFPYNLPFGTRITQRLYGYERKNRRRSGALISATE